MMEVSQSAPLADFKDIVQSKANGVLPTAAMVQEDIEEMEKLCFPENEENASVNEKIKSTSNGKVDLVEMLTKDDIETDNLLHSESVNGEDEGDANILATEDIDMLAEEFLNEIVEEDSKTEDDSIPDSRVENELLRGMEPDQMQEQKSLNEEKDEMKNSETKETEIDKEIDELEKIDAAEEEPMDEDFDELANIDDALESDIPDLTDIPEQNDEISDKAISNLEESNELTDVDKEEIEQNLESKKDDHTESNDCKATESDACAYDDGINENEDCNEEITKEEEADKEIAPAEEVQTQNTESVNAISEINEDLETEQEKSEDKCTAPVDKQEDVQISENEKEFSPLEESECEPTITDKNPVSDVITIEDDKNDSQDQSTVEQKNNEEDTFMSELSAAIDEHESASEKDSPDKSKFSECDIINLDSPLAIEDEKKTETSPSNLASDEIGNTDIQAPNDAKDQGEKDAEDAGVHSDDDDIMLVDSVNEEKSQEANAQIDSKTEREENIEDKQKDTSSVPNKFHSEASDTEDDDVVVVDDKSDAKDDKHSTLNEKKAPIETGEKSHMEDEKDNGNASDDDVVLLDDEKEDAGHQSETETSPNNKKLSHKENLEKDEKGADDDLLKEDDEKDHSKRSERKLSSVEEEKKDYTSDDDIVLLEDDDKEEEKSSESKLVNETEPSNEKTADQKKSEDDELNSAEEKIEEENKKSNETKKDRISDDEDDDVVLLDDEKDEESDIKRDGKDEKSVEENSKEKIVDDGSVEEEIFSIDTSVTERQKVEQPSKDDDDDDVVVLDSEIPEKKEKEPQEKIESEKENEIKTTSDVEKSSTEKENDKVITRSSSRKSSKEAETETEKDDILVPDNSDNAQDKFPEKSAEDDFSNNDGDNNLLQEVEPPQNSCSNDEDKQKFEVESSEVENSAEPPPKKIRVEADETSQTSLLGESKEQFKADCTEEREKTLKRSLSPDSSSQESKKLKTESKEEVVETDCKDTVVKMESDELLVPAPAPVKKVDLNLDFLKRFKKSISKMTKADLEELVLQKIVEAIVHKSEFSEMRDLIEKQEKIIATHRTKIAEITKQFRDLEMVHNRVLKDLETKNQQFIMPVKITRAVGLQVLIPKRLEQSGAKVSVERPTGTTPAPPQPPVNNTPEVVKRKCAQKITPLRPDTMQQSPISVTRTVPSQNGINSMSTTAQTSTPSTPQNQVKVQQKIITRSAPVTSVTPQQNIVNVINQQAAQTHYVVQQATLNQINTSSPTMQTVRKSTSLRQTTQPAVQRPPAPQSSPDRPRVPPMILKKTGANGRVLTVANPATISVTPTASPQTNTTTPPATKSVIDLTDEDDNTAKTTANTLPALVAIPTATQPTRVTYVVNKPNSAPQRVTVTQNSTSVQRLPVKPNSQYVAIASKPTQGLTGTTTGPRLPATTILRRSHPAPLPKSPPALSNPGWKAPPPRPSIRINNIDSGIVISWTMDEMTDQHAEITSYQIYAYQETNAPPQVEAWRHVGDVKAMLLPMAVTLTQFQEGQRYYFAVRAVDMHSRCGPFSMPKTWA